MKFKLNKSLFFAILLGFVVLFSSVNKVLACTSDYDCPGCECCSGGSCGGNGWCVDQCGRAAPAATATPTTAAPSCSNFCDGNGNVRSSCNPQAVSSYCSYGCSGGSCNSAPCSGCNGTPDGGIVCASSTSIKMCNCNTWGSATACYSNYTCSGGQCSAPAAPTATPTTAPPSTCTGCSTASCGNCSSNTNGWRCSCSGEVYPGAGVYTSCSGVQDSNCCVTASCGTPGDIVCADSTHVKQCGCSGWGSPVACYSNYTCSGGQCSPPAPTPTPCTMFCSGDNIMSSCSPGVIQSTCPNGCVNGACATCNGCSGTANGDIICASSTSIKMCNCNVWGSPVNCASGLVCSNGQCSAPAATPTPCEMFCDGNGDVRSSCNPQVVSQYCNTNGCAGGMCMTCKNCTSPVSGNYGTIKCLDTNTVGICACDGNWTTAACASGTICVGSACATPTPADHTSTACKGAANGNQCCYNLYCASSGSLSCQNAPAYSGNNCVNFNGCSATLGSDGTCNVTRDCVGSGITCNAPNTLRFSACNAGEHVVSQTSPCGGGSSGGCGNVGYCCALDNPPVDGVCGSADGTYQSSFPSSSSARCSAGTYAYVSTGNGQFNWECAGKFGGFDAYCHATASCGYYGGACYTGSPCSSHNYSDSQNYYNYVEVGPGGGCNGNASQACCDVRPTPVAGSCNCSDVSAKTTAAQTLCGSSFTYKGDNTCTPSTCKGTMCAFPGSCEQLPGTCNTSAGTCTYQALCPPEQTCTANTCSSIQPCPCSSTTAASVCSGVYFTQPAVPGVCTANDTCTGTKPGLDTDCGSSLNSCTGGGTSSNQSISGTTHYWDCDPSCPGHYGWNNCQCTQVDASWTYTGSTCNQSTCKQTQVCDASAVTCGGSSSCSGSPASKDCFTGVCAGTMCPCDAATAASLCEGEYFTQPGIPGICTTNNTCVGTKVGQDTSCGGSINTCTNGGIVSNQSVSGGTHYWDCDPTCPGHYGWSNCQCTQVNASWTYAGATCNQSTCMQTQVCDASGVSCGGSSSCSGSPSSQPCNTGVCAVCPCGTPTCAGVSYTQPAIPGFCTANSSCVGTVGAVNGVDGTCGSSNGGLFSSAPTTNLCTSGVGTTVVTSGRNYSWTCTATSGTCGGTNGVSHLCTAIQNRAPSYVGIQVKNSSDVDVPSDTLPSTRLANHICQTLLSSDRIVKFVVTASDPDGNDDITSIQLRMGSTIYDPVSLVNGVATFAIQYGATDPVNTSQINVIVTDTYSATTGWVDTNHDFKVWDCSVPVNGTIYDGSSGSDCTSGSGYTNPIPSGINFNLSYRLGGLSPRDMTVNSPTYSDGGNKLVWGTNYIPLFTNFPGADPTQLRITDLGNGNKNCATQLNLNNTNVNPYSNSPAVQVDYSTVMDQLSWFQVGGGGLISKLGATDSVPITCGLGNACIPAITINGGTNNNGIVAGKIDSNSGCGNNCKYGDPNNWTTTQNLVQENYDYNYFYNQYHLALSQGLTLPGNATMTNVKAIGGTGVIFINGNLDINENEILPANSYLMLVVKGSISIQTTVSRVDGVLMANSISATGKSDNQLVINGVVSSSNNVDFSRGYNTNSLNNTSAAVVVNYKPELIFLMPGKLVKTISGWKEGL